VREDIVNKKIPFLVTTILFVFILCAIVIIAGVLPVLGEAPDMKPGRVYPPSQEQPEIQVTYGGDNQRLMELNRVLGIPMEELRELPLGEIEKLYIDNADKLGVRVYRNILEKGREVIKLIAGNKVFKPDPANVPTLPLTEQSYPTP